MFKRIFSLFLLVIYIIAATPSPVYAQETNDYPIYIVQSGDTLYLIGLKFGLTVDEILDANKLINPNLLNVGDKINIPGFPGISGTLEIKTVNLGESIASISQKYQIGISQLANLNKVTSPTSLFAGAEIIVPVGTETNKPQKDGFISSESLIETALATKINPWDIPSINANHNIWDLLPGDPILLPEKALSEKLLDSTNPISAISISPLPLIQGTTVLINIKTNRPVDLTANLADHPIVFFQDGENNYYALEGIHALAPVGLKNMFISAKESDGKEFNLQQPILLSGGSFIQEAVNGVDASTIDPNVTKQEEDVLNQVTTTSPTRLWAGPFKYPVDEPCLGSTFGNRRTYNNGSYNYYHTGVDFSICKANNLNIYAPAPGQVIFTGALPTKGNYTVIDHGWGVFSCYAHQSQFNVKVGDKVDTGQIIGVIGNTGRSLGPHLHWEIWVNHIPVNPIDWVEKNYPD